MRNSSMTYYGYCEIVEDIKYRREQLLLHCCIYAEFNDALISDWDFYKLATELLELQKIFPQQSFVAPYHEHFKDWDGDCIPPTFPTRLPWVMRKARTLLNSTKRRNYYN